MKTNLERVTNAGCDDRYKENFEKGSVAAAGRCCRDHLSRLRDAGVPQPHRNHEIAAMALCSCLWAAVVRLRAPSVAREQRDADDS